MLYYYKRLTKMSEKFFRIFFRKVSYLVSNGRVYIMKAIADKT